VISEPPRILQRGGEYEYGSPLRLTCDIQSSPQERPVWLFNGEELPSPYLVSESEIFIERAGPHHSGTYTCVVGSLRDEVEVSVSATPREKRKPLYS